LACDRSWKEAKQELRENGLKDTDYLIHIGVGRKRILNLFQGILAEEGLM
jgi:hypothetical protein